MASLIYTVNTRLFRGLHNEILSQKPKQSEAETKPCTGPAWIPWKPHQLNLVHPKFSLCYHLPSPSVAPCNFRGSKCLCQLYPRKDCPNEWVCLKLKRVSEYHTASHQSGFPEQGQSRKLFLEGSTRVPRSQERGQWSDSLAVHHAELLRAVAISRRVRSDFWMGA